MFGPSTPREHTPQVTIQRPTTIYGVTKVAGELLCDYYTERFGVDVRGLRLPGLISTSHRPAGERPIMPSRFSSALAAALHLLPHGGYASRHDVHAGCHRRDAA